MERVLVIGGGIIGASIALELQETGAKVTLLDNQGHKSTDYAAGILMPNGTSRAKGKLGELNQRALQKWPDWEEKLGGGLRRKKGLLQLASPKDLQEIQAWPDLLKGLDINAEWLSESQARSQARHISPEAPIAGAVWIEEASSVSPRQLLARIGHLLENHKNSELREGEAKRLIHKDGQVQGMELTSGETINCEWVIAAGGYSSYNFLPQEARPELTPQKGERIIIKTGKPMNNLPITGTPGGSIVPRAAAELWVGVTAIDGDSTTYPSPRGIEQILRNALLYMPQLKDCSLKETGAGIRPVSKSGLPVVGQTPIQGLLLATGHGKDGILQSPLAAQEISRLINGR